MGDREVCHLASAVIFQAIRDAYLIEVGHRVEVCALGAWPSASSRQIIRAREWLITEPVSEVLLLWTTAIGITVEALREQLHPRLHWTEQMESQAPRTRRPQKGLVSGLPFRKKE